MLGARLQNRVAEPSLTCARVNADLAHEQLNAYTQTTPPASPIRIAVERVYARPN